ncbi:MAG: sel1 repeat family protein [Robiginitomaculum sp.]|nr:sel1 repeat family protein [Robiginitomaculum sp.]
MVFATASISFAQGTDPQQQLENSNALDQGVELYNQGKFNEAFVIFSSRAEAGNAAAQYNLGVMYDNGFGVEQSDAKAIEWYQRSADQGYAAAYNNLGVLYLNGQGVRQSNRKSFSLIEKSAELGFSEAQYNLGIFYLNSIGVRKSREKAIYWYQKAATQGDDDAVEQLRKLGVSFE